MAPDAHTPPSARDDERRAARADEAAVDPDAVAALGGVGEHTARARPEGGLGRLVTDGPFAWSRNSVFLRQIVLVWGVALGGDPAAAALALVVTVAAVTQVAVEERVIAAGPGAEYAANRARVNRWLGRKRDEGAG